MKNKHYIFMFKKKNKNVADNYRDINILSTNLKLVTKVITNIANKTITLSGEPQGFRFSRSCTEARKVDLICPS